MNVRFLNGEMLLYDNFNPWMSCLRNTIYFINAFFTLIAGFLIAIGIEVTGVYNSFDYFLNSYQMLPAQIVIGLAVVLIFVTLFGWFGAVKLDPLALNLYIAFLVALVCVEIALSIFALVILSDVDDSIHSKMFGSVEKFEIDERIRSSWNYVQTEYSCCGVYFPSNWYGIKENSTNGGALLKHRGFTIRFPYSCCVGGSCNEGVIHEEGCANYIIDYVSKATLLIAYLLIAIAIVQVISAVLTYLFGAHVQRYVNTKTVHSYLGNRSFIILSPSSISHKSAFI